MVATDHAPHGREKESGILENPPFGVTALETAFPVLFTRLVETGALSLTRLLASLTTSPARLLGIDADLEVGKKADLVVLDLKEEKVVDPEQFKSRGTNSPFIGSTLKGWPSLTLVNGKEKFSCS